MMQCQFVCKCIHDRAKTKLSSLKQVHKTVGSLLAMFAMCVPHVQRRVSVFLFLFFYVGGLRSVLQPTGSKQTSTLAYLSCSQWEASSHINEWSLWSQGSHFLIMLIIIWCSNQSETSVEIKSIASRVHAPRQTHIQSVLWIVKYSWLQ